MHDFYWLCLHLIANPHYCSPFAGMVTIVPFDFAPISEIENIIIYAPKSAFRSEVRVGDPKPMAIILDCDRRVRRCAVAAQNADHRSICSATGLALGQSGGDSPLGDIRFR